MSNTTTLDYGCAGKTHEQRTMSDVFAEFVTEGGKRIKARLRRDETGTMVALNAEEVEC